MPDRHVRRGQEEYSQALSALLPSGVAWPRDFESPLMRFVTGIAGIWGDIDGRAADLLEREADPRITLELLTDWERAWGLPDKCLTELLTIADRQIALVNKMTMLGGQSREFFIALAASIGYTITITEYAPFMFGISELGETDDGTGYPRWEIGPPEIRFYWTVHVGAVRLTWWRFGSAELGIDPHLRIALATDLECLFRRYSPAHTQVLFEYSELAQPVTGILYSDDDTFHPAAISGGGQSAIAGMRHTSSDVFFSSAIDLHIAGANFSDVDVFERNEINEIDRFFVAALTQTSGPTQNISGSLASDNDSFAMSILTQTISGATFNDGDSFATNVIAQV